VRHPNLAESNSRMFHVASNKVSVDVRGGTSVANPDSKDADWHALAPVQRRQIHLLADAL
jgi:hypothetical protein